MRYEKNNTVLPNSAVEFLDYCRDIKELSEKSVNGYEIDLKIFVEFLKIHKNKKGRNIKDIDIKRVELKDLNAFMSYLKNEKGNTASTRCRKIATLKAYFEYVQNVPKLITSDPTYGLKSKAREKTTSLFDIGRKFTSYSIYRNEFCEAL
jgi:site-specific recombinase XerD